MKRKLIAIIMSVALIIPFAQIGVYAQEVNYPKIENLKGKSELMKVLDEISRIRNNMSTVNITADASVDKLNSIELYILKNLTELNDVRITLEKYRAEYKDSFGDLYFSEEVQFIANSYIISLRQQQNLIRQLKKGNVDSKILFESDYLTPAYYYTVLGDQMYSYIKEYISIQ